MMFVTVMPGPPSCAAMLPHTFSAATTVNGVPTVQSGIVPPAVAAEGSEGAPGDPAAPGAADPFGPDAPEPDAEVPALHAVRRSATVAAAIEAVARRWAGRRGDRSDNLGDEADRGIGTPSRLFESDSHYNCHLDRSGLRRGPV
jgi:hypothetical protein